LADTFGGDWPIRRWLEADDQLHEETLRERIGATLAERYAEKEQRIGAATLRQIEKAVMLQTLDTHWKDHLAAMDYLRQGIHLRGYAQKNPKQEYKREAFEMFSAMLEEIKQEVTGTLAKLRVEPEEDSLALAPHPAPAREFAFTHEEFRGFDGDTTPDDAAEREDKSPAPAQPFVRDGHKTGRNEPCPCGSGKKFKHCHGKVG
jgi:preprotein translocase subunit SecA